MASANSSSEAKPAEADAKEECVDESRSSQPTKYSMSQQYKPMTYQGPTLDTELSSSEQDSKSTAFQPYFKPEYKLLFCS